MVFWVSASLDVEAADVALTTSFWAAVTGSALPAHLAVRAAAGPPSVRVHPHDDGPPRPRAGLVPGSTP